MTQTCHSKVWWTDRQHTHALVMVILWDSFNCLNTTCLLHPTRLSMKSIPFLIIPTNCLYIINSINMNTIYKIYNLNAFKIHLSVFENRGLADWKHLPSTPLWVKTNSWTMYEKVIPKCLQNDNSRHET